MFYDQLAGAIADARTLARLDGLSAAVWQSWSAGGITDDDASRAAELVHARKAVVRGEIKPVGLPPGRPSIFPPRREQRSPDRAASIARRRTLAASGPMPPALAARFSTGELAVLKIVAEEFRSAGACGRTLAEIAARAGVSRTTAKNALREAAALGLVTIEERRREGQVNLPNVVRIVSREWRTWLERGSRSRAPMPGPIGGKKPSPTDRSSRYQPRRPSEPKKAAAELVRAGASARAS